MTAADQRLKCAACGTIAPAESLNRHFLEEREHRHEVLALFLEDHPDQKADGSACDGRTRLAETWDNDERRRFGADAARCTKPIACCGCGYTFCAEHMIACGQCGRLACLRHRMSRRCPVCSPARRQRIIGVPKHDPFTKETKTVFRNYRKPGPPPWSRAAVD